jgi:alpha-beta hydrolase superfamily lysophospholipase
MAQQVLRLHRPLGAAAAALAPVACGSGDAPPAAGQVVASQGVATPVGLADGTSTRLLRYRMEAVGGGLTEATALLFTPAGGPPAGGWPLVVWAHGTTGVSASCAPSLDFEGFGSAPLVARLLAEGVAVLAPDYEGLGTSGRHPYYSRASHGRSVVRAVQAALALDGARLAPRWAVIGHSQGGHAALAAAEMAPLIEAQARLAAVVALAPGSDLARSSDLAFERVAQLVAAGQTDLAAGLLLRLNYYGALVAHGAQAQQADMAIAPLFGHRVRALLPRALGKPEGAGDCTDFGQALAADMVGWLSAGQDVLAYPGVLQHWHRQAGMAALLKDNLVGQNKLAAPVLVMQGELDLDVPAPVTRTLVAQMRAAGTRVELRALPEGDHEAVVAAPAIDEAARYLRERLVDL